MYDLFLTRARAKSRVTMEIIKVKPLSYLFCCCLFLNACVNFLNSMFIPALIHTGELQMKIEAGWTETEMLARDSCTQRVHVVHETSACQSVGRGYVRPTLKSHGNQPSSHRHCCLCTHGCVHNNFSLKFVCVLC